MNETGRTKREIVEIYTKSGTLNNISEVMKEVGRIRKENSISNFEELARYVCEDPRGGGILVELQVSTKWCRDNDVPDYIEITAYSFDGPIEEYTATYELDTIKFNGNWKTAIDQMRDLAEAVIAD